jgi:predicted DNA-binding transcriptional regulator
MAFLAANQDYGSKAKPTRREEVEVGVIFDFLDVKRLEVYPLRYTEDFSTSRKSESNPRSASQQGGIVPCFFREELVLEHVLQSIGLSKNESEIYLALLKYGELSVAEIATRSGVNRRNAYDCMSRLLEKGLIFEIVSSRDSRYRAVEPQKLTEILREKQNSLESIMPRLTSLYRATPIDKGSVMIYHGIEGWKNYMRDIVQVAQPFYCIGGKGAWMDERVMNFFPHFLEEAKRRKIQYKHLFDYEVGEKAHPILKQVGRNYKILPKGYSAPSSVDFFGDRVYICSKLYLGGVESDALFTVIVNPVIAESFRTWFNFMWDFCPASGDHERKAGRRTTR